MNFVHDCITHHQAFYLLVYLEISIYIYVLNFIQRSRSTEIRSTSSVVRLYSHPGCATTLCVTLGKLLHFCFFSVLICKMGIIVSISKECCESLVNQIIHVNAQDSAWHVRTQTISLAAGWSYHHEWKQHQHAMCRQFLDALEKSMLHREAYQ